MNTDRTVTSAPAGICCTAWTTADLPSNTKTALGTQLWTKITRWLGWLLWWSYELKFRTCLVRSYLWFIMEMTGYSPVPKGLSSLSHMVCALHASCIQMHGVWLQKNWSYQTLFLWKIRFGIITHFRQRYQIIAAKEVHNPEKPMFKKWTR